MNIVYLLLGSNEGNRQQMLKEAINSISQRCGVIAQQSHIYETTAWGKEDQPAFLNLATCLETELTHHQLLKAVQDIEHELGRQRTVKWGQRTLDIDILFYNNDIINLQDLKVPHPYLHERRFALEPMNEIAPMLIHPQFNKSITALLEECTDTLPVKKLDDASGELI